MLDSTIKSIISNARNILVGKVPNPQAQVDLITIAMIYKFMDDMDNDAVKYDAPKSFFVGELEPYAWNKLLSTTMGNEARISLYSEALEKLQISEQIPPLFRSIFKGAFLPFRDGATLTMFLKEINGFSYDDSENLGNAFEFLLSIMDSQGDAGQFRTPRHIIDFMVDVVNPTKEDTILDPACGTAGFLISAYKHILKHNSKDFDPENDKKAYAGKVAESAKSVDIEIEKNLRGDLLTSSEKNKLTENVIGYDISADMEKLALVNLYLHGFKDPNISEYDTLTYDDKWEDDFDIILANPPFMTPKGGIKPHKKFSIQANRSEVLFVEYIMEHLTLKGKAGIIVPEGIVFQSATAYKKLRKKLVEDDYLYAVVSLPSGIFQPYSGVKTSILFIDREIAKRTKEVLFVDVKNDGFDLGANRRAINKNDLPEAFKALKKFQANHTNPDLASESVKKYKIANLVPKTKIAEGEEYNLSGSRYIETVDYSNCQWEMLKLEEVCHKITDGTHRTPQYTSEGVPFLRVTDLTQSNDSKKFISIEEHNELIKRCKPEKGDILFSKNGTIGVAKTIDWDWEFSIFVSLCLLKPKKDLLNSKYLEFLMNSNNVYNQATARSKTGAITNLHLVDIKTIKIPLPPLEIQEELVKELDAYQQVIDGAKKVVENWKPTIPINPAWEKVKLGDVCDFIRGPFGGSLKKEIFKETGYLVYEQYHAINNDFSFGRYFIDEDKYKEMKRFKVHAEELIISCSGTMGRIAIIPENYKDGIINQALLKLTVKQDKLNNLYLKHILESDFFQQKYFRSQSGAAIQNVVSVKELKTIEIPLPSIEEQKEIVAKIKIEEQAIEQCKNLIKIHEEKIADKIKSIWCEEDV